MTQRLRETDGNFDHVTGVLSPTLTVALQDAATPPSRLLLQCRVCRRDVAATPRPKGPSQHSPWLSERGAGFSTSRVVWASETLSRSRGAAATLASVALHFDTGSQRHHSGCGNRDDGFERRPGAITIRAGRRALHMRTSVSVPVGSAGAKLAHQSEIIAKSGSQQQSRLSAFWGVLAECMGNWKCPMECSRECLSVFLHSFPRKKALWGALPGALPIFWALSRALSKGTFRESPKNGVSPSTFVDFPALLEMAGGISMQNSFVLP